LPDFFPPSVQPETKESFVIGSFDGGEVDSVEGGEVGEVSVLFFSVKQ
jgi:hypothetical protein